MTILRKAPRCAASVNPTITQSPWTGRKSAFTGAAPSTFKQQLAAPGSELAQQVSKDPYNFEFLGLIGEVAERDLENALTSRITETLREPLSRTLRRSSRRRQRKAAAST